MRTSRVSLLGGASLLALGLLLPDPAAATCNPSGGTISGDCTGYTNYNSIGSLTNTGTISSGSAGIYNDGTNSTIGTLSNSGTINGNTGISNGGSIGTLSNSGTISGALTGIYNTGTIGTLTNSGTSSGKTGIANYGSIGSLTNTGTISGGPTGIYNDGSIGTLSNSGTISGRIVNYGAIDTLSNNGTISSSYVGIFNDGTIGTLTNNGTITASASAYAIYNTGSIGTLTNSGTIAGNILNTTSTDLTINGGGNGTIGTFTGYGGAVGTITNTLSNLVFASGNLLLNDDIDVGAHSVINSGATLRLASARTITGAYAQNGGGLDIVVASAGGYGALVVSQTATVTHAAITISGSGLTAGESFTIVRPAGGGSYANDSATVAGTAGLTATITEDAAEDLVVTLSSGTSGGSTAPLAIVGTVDYGKIAATAGGAATGMGAALTNIAAASNPAATAFQSSVLASLTALPGAARPAAVKQLAPSQLTSSLQAARLGSEPATLRIETHELAASSGGGAAAGSPGSDGALWGQMLGGVAQRDSAGAADGYASSFFGLVGGADLLSDPDNLAGVAFSWARGWSSGTAGTTLDLDSYQLTGYGLHRWGPLFVDGQAGIGYDRFVQHRPIGFLGSTAQAHYDGEQYLVKGSVGYDLPVGGLTVTPLAGLRFLRVVSGGYAETGAGAADLTVNRRGVQALTQDLGGKLTWSGESDWGRLIPEVRLAWLHDYVQGPVASSGLIGGQLFTSEVARPAADGARLTLGLTLERAGGLTMRVEYEGEVRPDYRSNAGLLKTTVAF